MAKFRCKICSYIFDEEKEGKKWKALPADWTCPDCGVGKEEFEELK
jgi:rubredoxin